MIAVRHEGPTCWLTLEHAPCNEIGRDLLAALEDFVARFDASTTRTLIVHSAVDAGFCAGADLRELEAGLRENAGDDATIAREIGAFIDRVHRLMNTLDTLPCTTIGVIHGVCFGGGLELALTCDIRIAERNARFAFPELRLGLIPGFGGIPRLRRDVGEAVVRDLLLTGRSLNAKRAHEVGLVTQVVPRGSGLRAAEAIAAQTAKVDRQAQLETKAFAKTIPRAELEDEKRRFLALVGRPAVRKSLQTFVESTNIRPYLA